MAGALYFRAAKIYRKAQPFLARIWTIREEYLKQRDSAVSQFEQEEKALRYEIDYKKDELEAINSQIGDIKIVKSTVEFKLNNALSTQALYEFIDKRCNSEDYKKHLGLVSIIRKDFEILSELFTDHKKEFSQTEDVKTFRSLFDKPLERIILYIDDLDRCPEERVIEVLEAVNLLMAFPLFVVVVGVDPIWVRNALTGKYQQQFNQDGSEDKGVAPSDYLEKIFQIAFQLKKAEDSSIKNMLANLAREEVIPGVEAGKIVDEKGTGYSDADDGTDEHTAATPVREAIPVAKEKLLQALKFTKAELECIKDMSVILGNNPRLVKRYINIYRIIKSHDYVIRGAARQRDLESILLLLALSLSRFKPLMATLEIYTASDETDKQLSDFLNFGGSYQDENSNGSLKSELHRLLSNHNPKALNEKATEINRHIRFIKRFTF